MLVVESCAVLGEARVLRGQASPMGRPSTFVLSVGQMGRRRVCRAVQRVGVFSLEVCL